MEKFIPDLPDPQGITLSQPENGYRFSIDPFILASHVTVEDNSRIIDAGCGCGIISILIAKKIMKKYPDSFITGIEIQKELVEYANKNISKNKLEHNINILCRDLNEVRSHHIGARADILVANPPYKKKGTGRLNHSLQKAVARHEIHLNINQLFSCAKTLLHKNSRVYVIFPADRFEDLNSAIAENEFKMLFYRYIHTKKNALPKLVVVCAGMQDVKASTRLDSLYIGASPNQPLF